MKIKLTSVYVDDQDKALRFYTEALGFAKKTDVGAGGYRWLTVTSAEQPDDPELQLADNATPEANAYQQGLRELRTPAAMFFVDDIGTNYERPSTHAVDFRVAGIKATCAR